MLLHQFELDAKDWVQLQQDMDTLVQGYSIPQGVFSLWWNRLVKNIYWLVFPGFTILQDAYAPVEIQNRIMILAYKYLDRIPGCRYRAPRSSVEREHMFNLVRIHAFDTVDVPTYLPLHTEDEAVYDWLTVMFSVRKTLSGCDFRVQLPDDCERVIPLTSGVGLAFRGDLRHGMTNGHGIGIQECFVLRIPCLS